MVPQTLVHRLTVPMVVQTFNIRWLQGRMRRGQLLFLQRAGEDQKQSKMRAINHLAIQNLQLRVGDCVMRDGLKYILGPTAHPILQPRPGPPSSLTGEGGVRQ